MRLNEAKLRVLAEITTWSRERVAAVHALNDEGKLRYWICPCILCAGDTGKCKPSTLTPSKEDWKVRAAFHKLGGLNPFTSRRLRRERFAELLKLRLL